MIDTIDTRPDSDATHYIKKIWYTPYKTFLLYNIPTMMLYSIPDNDAIYCTRQQCYTLYHTFMLYMRLGSDDIRFNR